VITASTWSPVKSTTSGIRCQLPVATSTPKAKYALEVVSFGANRTANAAGSTVASSPNTSSFCGTSNGSGPLPRPSASNSVGLTPSAGPLNAIAQAPASPATGVTLTGGRTVVVIGSVAATVAVVASALVRLNVTELSARVA
jgi:hypothetical protein